MNQTLIFDKEAVEERFDGDMGFYQEVLELFFSQYDQKLQQLKELAVGPDREALRIEAHSMKGALANLGAMKASGVAKALEHGSKGEAPAVLNNFLDELVAAVQEFKSAVP